MARMRREELSEVVAGLLMEGKLAVTSVDSRDLVEPYSQLPKLFKKGVPTTEDLISALGSYALSGRTTGGAKHQRPSR